MFMRETGDGEEYVWRFFAETVTIQPTLSEIEMTKTLLIFGFV
jgi:hypothetical protein